MKALRLALGLICMVCGSAALAAQGPPGISEPLGAGPFNYRTGEGLNIRVTVLARLTAPYAMTFLPNGDMLITQRTGELKRIAKGTAKLLDVPELMQKKLRIEPGASCHKNGPAESYGCYGGLPEKKAANSQRKSSAPESQCGQLGPAVRQIGRQLEVLPEKLSA